MEISLLTPRCTLVPEQCFDPSRSREALAEVALLEDTDVVKYVRIPQYGAVLLYADSTDDRYSKTIKDISGKSTSTLPEMFYILRALSESSEHNRIVANWSDGYLYLAIAQGESLKLANVYRAQDFTTAEYFVFLAMKSLQLNPEQSTISWRGQLGPEEEMSLYRYFKSVESL